MQKKYFGSKSIDAIMKAGRVVVTAVSIDGKNVSHSSWLCNFASVYTANLL